VADYLTYDNIGDRVEALIDDADTTVRAIIDNVINDVYRDIIGEFRKGRNIPSWLKDYDDTLDTAASTRTTTLATSSKNVERIISVSVDNQPCLPVVEEELELGQKAHGSNPSAEFWWSTSNTSRPTRYRHEKSYASNGTETNKLYWFPLPDAAYDIRYWFESRVSPLSASTDVPILPPWAHIGLVYGALEQLAMFDIRVRSGPWSVLFDNVRSQLTGFSNNFILSGQTRPWGA